MNTTLVIATLSVALSSTGSTVAAFSVGGGRPQQTCQSESTALHATPVLKRMASWTAGAALALTLGTPALADEYGKEVEAPTLFTGETVMVSVGRQCEALYTKRGSDTAPPDLHEAWAIGSLPRVGAAHS